MDIPLRKYFLSPSNRNVDYNGMYSHPTLLHTSHSLESELRNQNELLSMLGVEVQPTRLFDILDAFRIVSYEQRKDSLLFLAHSLQVVFVSSLRYRTNKDCVVEPNRAPVGL